MTSMASMIWREILDAPIGATRLLAGCEYEKVQHPDGSTRWVSGKRSLTAVAMYEASINA